MRVALAWLLFRYIQGMALIFMLRASLTLAKQQKGKHDNFRFNCQYWRPKWRSQNICKKNQWKVFTPFWNHCFELNEEELYSPIKEIANQRCPGFDYFLEVFLVKEILEDLNSSVGFKSLEQQVDRIIHYAELDA